MAKIEFRGPADAPPHTHAEYAPTGHTHPAAAPTAHAATHASGGSDPVTPAAIGAQPLDSDLTTIAGLAPADGTLLRRVSGAWAGATLTKADVGLGSVDNTADTAKPVSTAQQTALNAKVDTTRSVTAGTGLTGGGTLAADRSFAVAYGTTAGTAAQGNDARLSDARAWSLYTAGGEADGEVPTWDAGTGRFVPAAPTGGGGGASNIRAIRESASSITLADTDDVVLFNTASAALTATLPSAVGRTGHTFVVKKLGANPLTIASASTIDGASSEVISMDDGFREVVSDGDEWHIIGGKIEPKIKQLTQISTGTITINAAEATVYRITVTGASCTVAPPASANSIDADTVNLEILCNAACTVTFGTGTAPNTIIPTGAAWSSLTVQAGKRMFTTMRFVSGVGWFLLGAVTH